MTTTFKELSHYELSKFNFKVWDIYEADNENKI